MPAIIRKLTISTKLYAIFALLICAILAQSLSSLMFSERMKASGDYLNTSFSSVDSLASFQSLIERHRRIVESSPAELDRAKIKAFRSELADLSEQIETKFTEAMGSRFATGTAQNAAAAQAKMQEMLRTGQQVISLADRFAHDQASVIAQGPYDKAGDAIQDLLVIERADRLARVRESATTLDDTAQKSRLVAICSALIALLLLAPLGLLITRSIVSRLKRISAAMLALSRNDADVEIPCRTDKDEVGAMAAALVVFKDNVTRIVELNRDQESLKQASAETRRRELNELANSFEGSVHRVVESVSVSSLSMKEAAEAMSGVAENTNNRTVHVIQQAEETDSQVTAVASATHQLAVSISDVAERAGGAAKVANEVGEESRVMREKMAILVASVGEINEVAETIGTIASQTNLLALNATIEAARAGDAGRGFAVVASEVKTLASQTTAATRAIAGQIEAVQAATTAAVQFIETFTGKVAAISESTSQIAHAVDEQRQSVDEIGSAAHKIAQSTKDLSLAIIAVREDAGKTSAAALNSYTSAVALGGHATELKDTMERFLTDIRAA
jgi:methyl-accepting chemotaxis protein